MTSKWTSKPIPDPSKAKSLSMDDQFVVLLLYGKNSFGDQIYSYLKIHLPNLPKLKAAIKAGKGFNPSDFGEVVAAGKGEPTTEVRAEITSAYQVLDSQGNPMNPMPVPGMNKEKKAWDEY